MNTLILFLSPNDWSPVAWLHRQGGVPSAGRMLLELEGGWIAVEERNSAFDEFEATEERLVRTLIDNPVAYLVEWHGDHLIDHLVQAVPAGVSAVIDNDHGLICEVSPLKVCDTARWLRAPRLVIDGT